MSVSWDPLATVIPVVTILVYSFKNLQLFLHNFSASGANSIKLLQV